MSEEYVETLGAYNRVNQNMKEDHYINNVNAALRGKLGADLRKAMEFDNLVAWEKHRIEDFLADLRAHAISQPKLPYRFDASKFDPKKYRESVPPTLSTPKKKKEKPLPTGKTVTTTKRQKKALKAGIMGITKPAIRRLAHRGGVKRISGIMYEEVRGILKSFVESLVKDSITITEHRKHFTVQAADVIMALKRKGKHLYGYD